MIILKKLIQMIRKLTHHNHFQSAIAQLGSSSIAIISFMILARTMSQETFGEWGLYLALSSFVDLLKSGFVATAMIKYSSGTDQTNKNRLLGSSWVLNLFTIFIVSLLNYTIYFTGFFQSESIVLFLVLYPIFALISTPFYYFIWCSQIDLNMQRIARIKIFNASLFLIVCITSFYINFNLQSIVLLYIASFAISSIICVLIGGTGVRQITGASKEKLIQLFQFGRYHVLVFLGSNLLRSSDTFLISAFLGSKALAIYLIPQRLWIMVVMPLASAITVGFPLFSANHNNKEYALLKFNIEKYIGILTLLYIPFAIILFFLSEPIVLLVGGERYVAATILFQIFLIYSVFVPFDQIVGISLDAVDKPNKNFVKISVMALFNILGDLIVLHIYQNIELVAWVTLGTTLSGAIAGYIMLRKEIPIEINSIIKTGYLALRGYIQKFISVMKMYNSN